MRGFEDSKGMWMNAMKQVLAGLLLCVLATPALAQVTVLTAHRIHTMDTNQPQAQAMAYDASGKILALGDAASLLQRYPAARRLDVGAATVVPGLIDAHGHLPSLGMSFLQVDLNGTRSKAEILARLKTFAATLPKGAWLTGRGWDQNDWPEQAFPTAADLDAAFPDRPVWLRRVDGHAGWANSAALRAVKRDLSGTWQPDGGVIRRDVQGRPDGVFIDNAMDLMDATIPAPDAATLEHALELAMHAAVADGLTGVHDAGITLEELRAYQHLADQAKLPLRVNAMAFGDGPALDWLCANGLYRHPSGRLQMRTVKLFADGALGSRGAALLQDYSDDHGNRGLYVTSPEAMAAATAKAKRCGVQVATHAIGDRGIRMTLDAYAHALGTDSGSDHRWRIEHVQVLAPEDLPRLVQLHLVASMQPTHATSDMPWAQARLGPQRVVWAYAWRKVRDAGVPLALGSDFPVESPDPRLGLYAAVTREDAQGNPPGGWYPDEKLTAFEALRGFTLGAAYAGFAENEIGSLAIGKRADFVVLAQDPLAVPEAQLRTLAVKATYVDGKPVFEAP